MCEGTVKTNAARSARLHEPHDRPPANDDHRFHFPVVCAFLLSPVLTLLPPRMFVSNNSGHDQREEERSGQEDAPLRTFTQDQPQRGESFTYTTNTAVTRQPNTRTYAGHASPEFAQSEADQRGRAHPGGTQGSAGQEAAAEDPGPLLPLLRPFPLHQAHVFVIRPQGSSAPHPGPLQRYCCCCCILSKFVINVGRSQQIRTLRRIRSSSHRSDRSEYSLLRRRRRRRRK